MSDESIQDQTNPYRTQRYPSPYLDIASTYQPQAKEVFDYARGVFYGNTIVRPVISKLAEYAITDITYTHPNDEVCEKWKDIFEDQLNMRGYMTHAGLNRYALGNHVMSIAWPIRRKFICKGCRSEQWEESNRWSYRYPRFFAKCTKCSGETEHHAHDVVVHDTRRIGLISWDVRDLFISYSKERPEKTKYFMRIPSKYADKIRSGYKHQIEGVPVVYIEAYRKNCLIMLHSDNVFHMKQSVLADDDMAWGKPESMAAFKKIHYGATLNKSQEAIAIDRSIPMDIFWPEASRGLDPIQGQNLLEWADAAETQMARHRRDPGYKVLMPGPTGAQRLGGDARMLLLTPEIENNNREIAGSMNAPLEMVFGGMNWNTGSIQMRMLENRFINHRKDMVEMLRWVMRSLAPYVNLPIIEIGMSSFKMADDPQTKAMAMQLYGMGLLSAKTLMKEWGWDWKQEAEQRAKEEVERALYQETVMEVQTKLEGKQALIRSRFQGQVQYLESASFNETQREATYQRLRNKVESLMRQQGNRQPDVDDLVAGLARVVFDAGPDMGQRIMETISYRSPSVAALVQSYIQSQQDPMQLGMGGVDPATGQPMQPGMPQQGMPQQGMPVA